MTDLLTSYARRLKLRPYRTDQVSAGVSRTSRPDVYQTFEVDQPWIIYTYGRIHDRFWPPWRSSRILGRAAIGMECAVCGAEEVVVGKIPRFRPVPDRGKHPERVRFLLAHVHPDKPHQMAWSRPLLNMFAMGPVDLSLLAMRLEADLRDMGETA